MTIGEHDEQRVTIAIPPALARRGDHALDLVGSQMLAGTQLQVLLTVRRATLNISVNGAG